MDKRDRVAAIFKYFDREVVLVEVLVHLRFHLSIFQYFSSRARCSHNSNEPYRSTVGKMSEMFCTRVLLLELITH